MRARVERSQVEAKRSDASQLRVQSTADIDECDHAKWGEHVRALVRASQGGIELCAIPWLWEQRFPEVDIKALQPVQKMKSAVKNYVEGVEVTPENHVVLVTAPGRGPSQSRSPSPSRSRSPSRLTRHRP